MSTNQVTIVRRATAGAAQLDRRQPGDRDADARERRRERAEGERAGDRRARRRRRSSPPDRDPDRGDSTVTTTIAADDREPARHRPSERRASGVARSISSRPEVSSRRPAPTSVAAARPARISPNSTNRSWRNPPTLRMSDAREDRAGASARSPASLRSARRTTGRTPAMTRPKMPSPSPHARAVGRPLPNGAAGRPAEPDEGPRQARRRDRARRADVAPDERLDADDEEDDDRDARPASATASRTRPASGMWFDVQPNQVRLASGASAGIARLVAVEDEAAEHHRAGDRRRPRRGPGTGRARRRGRPRRAPGARARARSRRGRDRDLVAGQRAVDRAGDRRRGEDRDDAIAMTRTWPGQLLERDPAAASSAPRRRTRGCPARLRGERADSARIDQRLSDDREERAVLVLDVAAQRLDVDGLPARPWRIGGTGRDEVGELLARLRAWRTRWRSPAVTPIRSRTRTTATMIVARRESRSVLPKTLPSVPDDRRGRPAIRVAAEAAGGGSSSCQAAWPASRPYSARNVSSSDGSRLTKSSSS